MFSEKSTRCMSSKQITCGSPERSTLGMKVSQKKAVRLKNEPCYCRFLRLIYHIRSNIFKRTHHTTKCFCTLFKLIQQYNMVTLEKKNQNSVYYWKWRFVAWKRVPGSKWITEWSRMFQFLSQLNKQYFI